MRIFSAICVTAFCALMLYLNWKTFAFGFAIGSIFIILREKW